jgi:serine/threonine protein kinase
LKVLPLSPEPDFRRSAPDGGTSPYPDTILVPGAKISDKIRLIAPLGFGGMGTVWRAEHLGLETEVAVKFMSAQHARDPRLVERFAREGRMGARIRSPHVVSVFDCATTPDGVPYIVMELLEGEDLDTRIQREGALGLDLVLRILLQTGTALGHAHAMGIVHRDIKPDNIFLVGADKTLFVKLLDFGIAKQEYDLPGLTTSGSTIGTPYFMSPEQLLDPKRVGERSDLWSLGVVVYHCLTGRVPFAKESFGAICVAINEGSFIPPSRLSSRVPPGIDAWMTRALCREVEGRFRSANEMCEAFVEELARAGRPRPNGPHGWTGWLGLLAVALGCAGPSFWKFASFSAAGTEIGNVLMQLGSSRAHLPPLNPTPPSEPARGQSDPVPLRLATPWKTFAEPDLRAPPPAVALAPLRAPPRGPASTHTKPSGLELVPEPTPAAPGMPNQDALRRLREGPETPPGSVPAGTTTADPGL